MASLIEEHRILRRQLRGRHLLVTDYERRRLDRNVLEISHPAKLTRQQLTHPSIALGEDLEHVPVGSTHDVADVRDEVGRDLIVEQVAHGIDEDLSRAFPVQRWFQLLGYESQIEAALKGVSGYATEALSEHLRLAELAARAHSRAAPDRVPGRVRPLNGRPVAHGWLVYVLSVTVQVKGS